MEIAILGSEDFATGFKLAGVKRVESNSEKSIDKRLELLLKDEKIGIILVHEDDYKKVSIKIKKEADKSLNHIVMSISSEGKEDIAKLLKKSFGVDLWATDK